MNNKIKSLVLLPVISVLSACGIRLKEVYPSDGYNNTNFALNYYKEYDKEIDPSKPNQIVKTIDVPLDDPKYSVTESYEDAKTKGYTGTDLNYVSDDKPNDDKKNLVYGPTYKLSNYDESFKYGYISKLFDGQMFCHGGFELVRVQGDERGFGRLFEKEVTSMSNDAYFALNFKPASNVNAKQRANVPNHKSSFELFVSFYLKDGNYYTQIKTSHTFTDIPTNKSDSFDGSNYSFFAFKLADSNGTYIDITRCKGFSLSYRLINDELSGQYENYVHSLLFYEMIFKGVTWR